MLWGAQKILVSIIHNLFLKFFINNSFIHSILYQLLFFSFLFFFLLFSFCCIYSSCVVSSNLCETITLRMARTILITQLVPFNYSTYKYAYPKGWAEAYNLRSNPIPNQNFMYTYIVWVGWVQQISKADYLIITFHII